MGWQKLASGHEVPNVHVAGLLTRSETLRTQNSEIAGLVVTVRERDQSSYDLLVGLVDNDLTALSAKAIACPKGALGPRISGRIGV